MYALPISIHGITEEMVKDKPFFKDIAKEVHGFIGDADLAGYNSYRFDVPLLMEELDRAGHQLDMTTRRTINVMRIFTKMKLRNTVACLKYYRIVTKYNTNYVLVVLIR